MKETSIFTHTGIANRLVQRLKGYGERNQTPSHYVKDNVQSLQLLQELVASFSIVSFRGQLKTEPHSDWSTREVQLYFVTVFPDPHSLRPVSTMGRKENEIVGDQRPSKRFERESGKGTKWQCQAPPPPSPVQCQARFACRFFQLIQGVFCCPPPPNPQ